MTKQKIIIGIVVLFGGFVFSWFTLRQSGKQTEIQNNSNVTPTINPESDCCSKDQKMQEFECMPNCPPTMVTNEVFIVGYRCLSPEEVSGRNRYGCPK